MIPLSPRKLKSRIPRMADQVVEHLFPNRISGFFEFCRERGRFVFKGLQKPLSAQIQRN
jgi:hypothetical protein